MASEIKIKGLKELQSFLDKLPAKMERNVMRGALRRGAREIFSEARARVPVGPPSSENKRLYGGYPGALRDSLRISARIMFGHRVVASVKAGGKLKSGADVYYAHMVEYGTKPHKITSRDGMTIGGKVYYRVQHPGTSQRPFMRPALDAKHQAAILQTAAYIRKKLETKYGIETPEVFIEVDE